MSKTIIPIVDSASIIQSIADKPNSKKSPHKFDILNFVKIDPIIFNAVILLFHIKNDHSSDTTTKLTVLLNHFDFVLNLSPISTKIPCNIPHTM